MVVSCQCILDGNHCSLEAAPVGIRKRSAGIEFPFEFINQHHDAAVGM